MSKYLTNERLRSKLINNFKLVNYGIQMAKRHLREGQQITLDQILAELLEETKEKSFLLENPLS